MDSVFLAAAYALSAALAWGSGDFSAGHAARKAGPLRSVLFSYLIGLLTLIIAALAISEKIISPVDLAWGALAGTLGMIGLGFLLRGFVSGRMGIVAPVSAVLATIVPMIFTSITEGLPQTLQLLGFSLALLSIWLLSRPESLGIRPEGVGMGLLAGLCFGGFFISLDQIHSNAVLWPLVAGRLTSIILMGIYMLLGRVPLLSEDLPARWILLAGVLDVAGNLFFLLAVQTGRLDVAAVLGSLYPAVTALLAWLIGNERLTHLQKLGVAGAVVAIMMITL